MAALELLNIFQAECEYYKEVHQLDLKYQKKYDEINESRNKIIAGNYEPSGAEVIRRLVVDYHVTIVAIGHGLLKKFWPFGT